MSGLLYLLALIAVPWLVAWTICDPARTQRVWWPFDMKGDRPPVQQAATWRERRARRMAGQDKADIQATAAREGEVSLGPARRGGYPVAPPRSTTRRPGPPGAGSRGS